MIDELICSHGYCHHRGPHACDDCTVNDLTGKNDCLYWNQRELVNAARNLALDQDSKRTQNLLKDAEILLEKAMDSSFAEDNPKLQMLYALILSVRVYSASANTISGLRGLGLDEACDLAKSIIDNPPKSDRDIQIKSYRLISESLSLNGSKG